MCFFNSPSALIVDELGCLPMPDKDVNALSHVIPQSYLNGLIILTTNRGVASWGDTFGDTAITAAMRDGLLHCSVVFSIMDGSCPVRAHQTRSRKLTQRGNTQIAGPSVTATTARPHSTGIVERHRERPSQHRPPPKQPRNQRRGAPAHLAEHDCSARRSAGHRGVPSRVHASRSAPETPIPPRWRTDGL